MNREEIQLVVLGTLAEIAASDPQRQLILQRMDIIRFSEAMRSRDRRAFLLRALLYVTLGILVLLAFAPLGRFLIVAPFHPVPTIEVRPLDDGRPFDPAIRRHLS